MSTVWWLFPLCSRLLPWYLRPVKTSSEADNDGMLVFTVRDRWSNIEADLADIITDVAILVAFGALFPPIAVIGLTSIAIRTGFIQFFFGRLAHLSSTTSIGSTLRQVVEKVEEECAMTAKFVYESLLSLPLLILCVWSLFLFDIAGDEVGFFQAIWIVFVFGIIGLLWNYCNRREVSRRNGADVDSPGRQENELGIELRDTVIAEKREDLDNASIHMKTDNPLHVQVM